MNLALLIGIDLLIVNYITMDENTTIETFLDSFIRNGNATQEVDKILKIFNQHWIRRLKDCKVFNMKSLEEKGIPALVIMKIEEMGFLKSIDFFSSSVSHVLYISIHLFSLFIYLYIYTL